jgi:hypothetical protein
MKKDKPAKNPTNKKAGRGIANEAFVARKHPNFSSENQPANPGRPVGSTSLKALLQKVIDGKITLKNKNGEITFQGERKEAMSLAIAAQAIKGNVKAYAEICDRLEGKAQQNVKLSGDPVDPIIIQERKQIENLPPETVALLLKTLYPDNDGNNKT